jgi:hypothetical protein
MYVFLRALSEARWPMKEAHNLKNPHSDNHCKALPANPLSKAEVSAMRVPVNTNWKQPEVKPVEKRPVAPAPKLETRSPARGMDFNTSTFSRSAAPKLNLDGAPLPVRFTGHRPLQQEGGPNPQGIPTPTVPHNDNEVGNLWTDIGVSGAQALVGSSNPGEGQNIVIVDSDGAGHGAYTSNIAGADASYTENGQAFPGIAPGANTSIVGFSQDYGHIGDRAWDGLMGLASLVGGQQFYEDHVASDNLARGLDETFNNATSAAGADGIVAFTNAAPGQLNADQAVAFLEQVQSYTEGGGVVVLPGNFFSSEVGSDPRVQEALAESGAIITQPLYHNPNGGTPAYVDPTTFGNGQPPTSSVNVGVPTTNGNNSVAVPAVAGTVALIREANPDLTSAQITELLTNPANMDTVTLSTGETVTVLNAERAVQAAQDMANP